MKNCFLIILSGILSTSGLKSQSIITEVGLSKHFVSKTDKYEQPNLHAQVRHIINSNFDYYITYSCIKQYWPFEYHVISQFGDPPEIYTRYMWGLDASINLIPLFTQDSVLNLGFAIGPSVRKRNESFFYDCHYTSGGWFECFINSTNDVDFGINCIIDFDFAIWKNIGVSMSSIFRIYESSVPTLSFNAGLQYKFIY